MELGALPAQAKSPVRASGLAFLPITLSFHNIVYEVRLLCGILRIVLCAQCVKSDSEMIAS
jgi:hypothetical protein